jgi:hypothetical protein
MRILGRILIILAVFALVMGITYLIVNARGSSAPGAMPGFEPGNERFSASDGAPPGFPEGGRPEFPGGGRNEFRGERRGGGWLFGALKNIAIIGIIVALIVVPKRWLEKKRRAAKVADG